MGDHRSRHLPGADRTRLRSDSARRALTALRGSAPLGFPSGVVQLHLTDQCNLSCSHCYSSSSPARRTQLETDQCIRAIEHLSAVGYRQLSISGGEPTLHPGFDQIVAHARSLGLHTSAVTNGLVSSNKVLAMLSNCDSVAVSVDGTEATHDELRRRNGSYRSALKTVTALREQGGLVGMVSCVTVDSLPQLPDLWSVAADLGVDLFQVRPLASVGRGTEIEPKMPDLDRLALVASLLNDIGDGPRVHCDLVGSSRLLSYIEAILDALDDAPGRVADLLSPLIIDESGNVRPYAYNLRGFDLGAIDDLDHHTLRTRVTDLAPSLRRLHRHTSDRVSTASSNFVDWYELLVDASHAEVESPVALIQRSEASITALSRVPQPT